MKNSKTISERPISPCISIYRWSVTMAMSIAHRVSGGALYIGTIFLAVWLTGIAYGKEIFGMINTVYNSFPGRAILFLYTFALVHHLIGGMRHLFWDINPVLLEKHRATTMTKATIFISIILTFLIWGCVYIMF
ncbi:MAG: cytochrome b subunit [Candidatus Tokpelaia sp. JSC189]|nr:MAG: cytochrome b subunit [Candidatus Tokpelaia sp. JSC189]